MRRSQGNKIHKIAATTSKKLSKKAKRVTNKARKKTGKTKSKTQRLLTSATKKLNKLKNRSSKALINAKDKVYASEEEILEYVKTNPVKSLSAVALAGLIAGFITKFKKGR